MALSKNQWELGYDILSKFERKLLDPQLFKWKYFEEQIGCNRTTLHRNEEFKAAYDEVAKLIGKYKDKGADYSLQSATVNKLEAQIKKLKKEIQELEDERDQAREALAYAAMVARRRNIDPEEFTEGSPLLEANIKVKDDNVLDLDDPLIAKFRKKKK